MLERGPSLTLITCNTSVHSIRALNRSIFYTLRCNNSPRKHVRLHCLAQPYPHPLVDGAQRQGIEPPLLHPHANLWGTVKRN